MVDHNSNLSVNPKKLEVLGVVQARGGSKGIPGKNIRNLGGYPLIAYSIASALASESVTRLIISTDDEEIAEVARIYGAEVPFMRPDALATDDAPDFPLFDHALTWLKSNENYVPQIIVQLRPTSPLRPKGSIDTAVKLLSEDNQADCVRTVIPSQQNPYKMWRAAEKYLNPLLGDEFPEPYNMPRQKLPKTYWQTGHLDVIRYETITEKNSLTGERVLPLIIEPKYCTDIDNLDDWEHAEWKLSRNNLDIDFPKKSVLNRQSTNNLKNIIPSKPVSET